MSSFEDKLKATVGALASSYQEALLDLKNEVTQAASAVAKLTHNKATLELYTRRQRSSGTIVVLRMVKKPRYYDIDAFELSQTGYPIKAAPSLDHLDEGSYEALLDNAPGLGAYFEMMASNPESALVLRLAIILREIPSQAEEEDQP